MQVFRRLEFGSCCILPTAIMQDFIWIFLLLILLKIGADSAEATVNFAL